MTPNADKGRRYRRWFCHAEWKPQDCWLGVYWDRKSGLNGAPMLDVWVCLLPTLPIHFGWRPSWLAARQDSHGVPHIDSSGMHDAT